MESNADTSRDPPRPLDASLALSVSGSMNGRFLGRAEEARTLGTPPQANISRDPAAWDL